MNYYNATSRVFRKKKSNKYKDIYNLNRSFLSDSEDERKNTT